MKLSGADLGPCFNLYFQMIEREKKKKDVRCKF